MDEKTKKTQEICAGGEPPRAKGELTFGKLAAAITFCLRAGACG